MLGRLSRVTVVLGVLLAGISLAAQEPPVTLAVLNFANRNPDDGWDWLRTGLADMLITDLTNSGRFQVVGREEMVSLMRAYDVGATDEGGVRNVARQARADHAVAGHYEVKGEAISLVAYVVNVKTGEVRRVETVTGPVARVLALEKKLALDLIARFNVTLTPEQRALLETVPTDDLDAAAHTYRAVDLIDDGHPYRALVDLRKAVRLDRRYGRAGLLLAGLYADVHEAGHARAEYLRVGDLAVNEPDACTALLRFIALPGETQETVAVCRRIIVKWPRAFGINEYPPRAVAADRASRLLIDAGRVAEAIRILQGAKTTAADDYFHWGRNTHHNAMYYALCMSGQTAEGAPEDCESVVVITPEKATHRAENPRYRSWKTGDISSKHFQGNVFVQAARGHYLKSIRVRAQVKSVKAKDASVYLFRPGAIAVHHVYGTRATLGHARNSKTGELEEIAVAVDLAPGTRSVRVHLRNGAGSMLWWETTAELAPLGETGALAVECEPPAKLLIDGRPGGTTADAYPCVPTGEYTIAADYTGTTEPVVADKVFSQRVTIRPGQATHVRFSPRGEDYARLWDHQIAIHEPWEKAFSHLKRGLRLLPDGQGGLHVIADAPIIQHGSYGRVRSTLVHGRWRPGDASVELRRLPPHISLRRAADPDMIREPRGSYLLAFTEPRKNEIDVLLCRSWDLIEWGPPVRLVRAGTEPSLVSLGRKRLALFTHSTEGHHFKPHNQTVLARLSQDGGATWSEPRTLGAWPAVPVAGRGSLSAFRDERGVCWVVSPSPGAVRVWSSVDMETWQTFTYTKGVYNRAKTMWYGWTAHVTPVSGSGFALIYATDQHRYAVTVTRDGKVWSTPRPFSAYSNIDHIVTLPDRSLWLAGSTTGHRTWLAHRLPMLSSPEPGGDESP